jgi:hypothetical protein
MKTYKLTFKTKNNKSGDKVMNLLWNIIVDIKDIGDEIAINRDYNVKHKKSPNKFEVTGLTEKGCELLKNILTGC